MLVFVAVVFAVSLMSCGSGGAVVILLFSTFQMVLGLESIRTVAESQSHHVERTPPSKMTT